MNMEQEPPARTADMGVHLKTRGVRHLRVIVRMPAGDPEEVLDGLLLLLLDGRRAALASEGCEPGGKAMTSSGTRAFGMLVVCCGLGVALSLPVRAEAEAKHQRTP